ncbi:MAG: c-type cytochrome [Gammaproteobacteria bacterium]|nr:c-type cytochrome [Gammaproteobacteria bacterium]MDH3372729.1 c-type cytochrome [Gammaproteobacteria bacterium]MDH3409369.1 c-type cytochrome [Gammaproteobacteria bacterium]MDH3550993.1 c-type cytochrome [Gammaproteobacteria bacterium]
MKRYIVSLFVLFMLAGCGPRNAGEPARIEPEAEEIATTETAWLAGKQAYEEYCAGCHEEGLDGAPRTGDRDAWDKRSWLWEAVLFEHARTGYGDMPAKGGDAELDEATVTKAAEYMLTLTYPETHRD